MNAIPEYPQFCKLDIRLKDEFNGLAAITEPYAEFNFTNTFVWDINETTSVSKLHGNLVIKMPRYVTGTPFVTFIGTNRLRESVDTLLNDFGELGMVPETVVSHLDSTNDYHLELDRDEFDYIFTVDQLIELPGRRLKGRRNHGRHFVKNHLDVLELRKTNFNNPDHIAQILDTFKKWGRDKGHSEFELKDEFMGLNRILTHAAALNQIGIQVFIDGECVGFSINEVVHEDYAMSRFQKALLSFDHLDIFLSSLVAMELKHFGCKYVSWEADQGIEGLRNYKLSYDPVKLLKKYTISKK